MTQNNNETPEQVLKENLEKIVAILDVLLYRIRKLRRDCEKDTMQEAEVKELILKAIDGITNMIELERNHFEEGIQPVPADYAEDRAIGYAQYILQMGRKTITENVAIPARRAQVLDVLSAVEKIIAELKKERGLEDVLVTQNNETVEGNIRFSVADFAIPDTALTYEECVGRIAQLEWILAHYEDDGYARQWLAERLPEWRTLKDSLARDSSDFPEPVFEDPGMIPDPHTCMAKAEENEELAARARACGRDDLAEQYESVAARWRYLYEEAEDEEMEW